MKKSMVIIIVILVLLVGMVIWIMTASFSDNNGPASNGFVPAISVRQYLKFTILSLFSNVVPAAPDTITFSVPEGWQVEANKRVPKPDSTNAWLEAEYHFTEKSGREVPSITLYRVGISESNSLASRAQDFSSSAGEFTTDPNCTIGNYKGICLTESHPEGVEAKFAAFLRVSDTVGLYAYVRASSDPQKYQATLDTLNQILAHAAIDSKTEVRQ